MGVKLQSALGGSVELNAPSTASNFTMTVPAGNGTVATTDQLANFRNRIINGDMRIDQRNSGSLVTGGTALYTLDRWQINCPSGGTFTTQRVADAPAGSGMTHCAKITVTSAKASPLSTDEYVFRQSIEGYNLADFEFGTSNAKMFTASFWVKSSLTGTHSGAVRNALANRGYSFTYTINSANTWEYKTLNVPGDITGTWDKWDSVGMRLQFDLGCGDSLRTTAGSWVSGSGIVGATGAVRLISNLNATWQITGVQLEPGSVATPFERRPQGLELTLCQRYYESSQIKAYSAEEQWQYRVEKRANPTISSGWVQGSTQDITNNRVGLIGLQTGNFFGISANAEL